MSSQPPCPVAPHLQNQAVIAADWVGFLALGASAGYLVLKLMRFTGPERDDIYFMGYREEKMLSVFVNLFAAMAYWAKLASHANGDCGPAAQIMTYKYLDYLATCPLLTVDLLWTLNLPYKFTYGATVGVCIVCAFMASTLDGAARYMWFGMGIILFGMTWWSIIKVVRIRLDQFVGHEAKKVRSSLKIACMTYFGIWCGYPTLWVLEEVYIIDPVVSAVLHTVLDVLAKSVYGFALLHFVIMGEKKEFIFVRLKPDITPHPSKEYDDEEEEGHHHGPRMIGSKVNSKHKEDFHGSHGASMEDHGTWGGHAIGGFPGAPFENKTKQRKSSDGNDVNDEEIHSTMDQIEAINNRLNTLMSRQAGMPPMQPRAV